MNNQLEGTNPNVAGVNRGKEPTSGTMSAKVRKASVTPSPSDKGNMDKGKG